MSLTVNGNDISIFDGIKATQCYDNGRKFTREIHKVVYNGNTIWEKEGTIRFVANVGISKILLSTLDTDVIKLRIVRSINLEDTPERFRSRAVSFVGKKVTLTGKTKHSFSIQGVFGIGYTFGWFALNVHYEFEIACRSLTSVTFSQMTELKNLYINDFLSLTHVGIDKRRGDDTIDTKVGGEFLVNGCPNIDSLFYNVESGGFISNLYYKFRKVFFITGRVSTFENKMYKFFRKSTGTPCPIKLLISHFDTDSTALYNYEDAKTQLAKLGAECRQVYWSTWDDEVNYFNNF